MSVRSILIVVFDGLQPSQVTPQLMPNLASFATEGVTFANHHAVFPTVTRANAASMATGCYPGRHGLAANTVVFRDFDPDRAFSALEPILSQVHAALGRVLLVPTLADVMAEHDQEYVAVVSGTSGQRLRPQPERRAGRRGRPSIPTSACPGSPRRHRRAVRSVAGGDETQRREGWRGRWRS